MKISLDNLSLSFKASSNNVSGDYNSILAQASQLPVAAPQRRTLEAQQLGIIKNVLNLSQTSQINSNSFTYDIADFSNDVGRRTFLGRVVGTTDGKYVGAQIDPRAIVNQGLILGVDRPKLAQAVAAQEVLSKIVFTNPQLAKMPKSEMEARGELASLLVYPGYLSTHLMVSANQSSVYEGIRKLTNPALSQILKKNGIKDSSETFTQKFTDFFEQRYQTALQNQKNPTTEALVDFVQGEYGVKNGTNFRDNLYSAVKSAYEKEFLKPKK